MTYARDHQSKRPWPPRAALADMPCTCVADGAEWVLRCNGEWVRCNARLAAIRDWQWDEETRLGVPHPEGATDPRAAGGGA